ncbi:glycosyltransferase [Zhouia sp. PK063]|uniref:glycosyltransferase n=1 Tax=Zhouia sp. PK063 TaxID=3373602 RepID=UPI0037A2580A
MRVGMNPQKEEKKLKLTIIHRIIVVVYIPQLSGFYKDSFEVFKLCINSLHSSINNKAAITVVNNGSCKEVYTFLDDHYNSGKIDTVIHHKTNIGKIDAQIGAARGAREPLITLTDSDILFKKGWQENVENVFSSFENVGSVSPIPVKGLWTFTSSTLKNIILRKYKFNHECIPENFEDYNKFLQSINWDVETDKNIKFPVISTKVGAKAIVGSAHQVLTIDRNILFETTPIEPSLTLVGGNSEMLYVDEPIDRSGRLRLSTYNNYAYHMGNTIESWMFDVLNNNEQNIAVNTSTFNLQNIVYQRNLKHKSYSFRKRVIKIIFKKLYGNRN